MSGGRIVDTLCGPFLIVESGVTCLSVEGGISPIEGGSMRYVME